EAKGISQRRIDITASSEALTEIFRGIDVVFHVAAKVDMWGSYDDFYRTNVLGTRNIILACRQAGVRRLVYTSSPSVVADGSDLLGVDETYPYAKEYKAYYPATKALAEQEVLAANDDSLFTCALRPHLIWGPGDTNLIPTVLVKARSGRLMQIGQGNNLVDFSYIKDCVHAHLCAARALDENPASRGQAYFISQGEPTLLWEWIGEILDRNGIAPITRTVPSRIATVIAGFAEFFARCSPIEIEPFLTKFLVSEMSTSHYFCIEKAKRLLGYVPQYTMAEAMEETFAGQVLCEARSAVR
ncbi:MAG: NAD-dependent epimerase/dehydratase family protein, partial [Bdellovibrionales bacterium]|nr:NAD-dependent epimerase/dehydratase family protein [Bdellovibrionales bacterium]